MSVLKPCPFCGGTAEFERFGSHLASCIIRCEICGCRLETGEVGDMSGSLWDDSMASRRISQLEAQVQEADVTATAMGLALTEARMENERLREALIGSDAALEDAYLEGAASQYMGEKGDADEFNKSKMAWKAKRDELLKKEGA